MVLTALATCVLLPSCVAQRLQKQVDAEKVRWIGRKESELLNEKGAPTRIVDTSDWKIWVYQEGGRVNLPGSAHTTTTPGVGGTSYSTTTFSGGNSIGWRHDWEYWLDKKSVIQKVALQYQYGQ